MSESRVVRSEWECFSCGQLHGPMVYTRFRITPPLAPEGMESWGATCPVTGQTLYAHFRDGKLEELSVLAFHDCGDPPICPQPCPMRTTSPRFDVNVTPEGFTITPKDIGRNA